MFENDAEFINRHPEVVQRQLMLWDAKFQQLSKTLKISKADLDRKARSDELAASASSSPEKPKRRRTMSRSRTRSIGGGAGSGVSDLSDGEVESPKERNRRPSGQTSRARRNSGIQTLLFIREFNAPFPQSDGDSDSDVARNGYHCIA